jgi:NADH-quinone oxidoreductase subunit G
LVASCCTTVMDGMEVKSGSSERVSEARKSVTEFLLINHPARLPNLRSSWGVRFTELRVQSRKRGYTLSRRKKNV